MKETTHTLSIAGRELRYRHVDLAIPAFALILRLAMGWLFLEAGIDKLITNFSAAGFLTNATKGPLAGWFQDLGTNQAALNVIDPLVIWGEILIGAALVLGLATRFALLSAGTMMLLFFLSQMPAPENPFLDFRLVYLLVFALLGALGAGRILGLDALIEKWEPVKRVRLLEYALG